MWRRSISLGRQFDKPSDQKAKIPAVPATGTEASGRLYGSKTAAERREERRARMLDAGLELFGSDGFRSTTIEALCASAGVSTRNFYEEFGSREALVLALHDQLNHRALHAVVTAIGQAPEHDVPARVRAGTAAYLQVMTSDRRWARIALVESVGVSAEAEAHRRAAIERFVALIEAEAERLADAGLVEPRDYHLTAVALAGALNGLINTWTANPDWSADLPRITEEAVRLIVLALGPRPSAPGPRPSAPGPRPSALGPRPRPDPAAPDRRPPTADRRPPTADRRPGNGERAAG
jgi:AcrR family transcriptional regulator